MFQTQYPVPPPQYMPQDYRTPPRTSPAAGGYYSTRQYSYATPPRTSHHTRRATHDYNTYTFTYNNPRKATFYSTQDYASSPNHNNYQYSSQQSTPLRKPDYVSDPDRHQQGAGQHYYHHHGVPPYYDEYLPRYSEKRTPPPPPYERHQSHRDTRADHVYRDQEKVYTPAAAAAAEQPAYATTPPRTRHRRASHHAKPSHPPPRTRPVKTPRKATAEDARRAEIPAGYSYKNWDPNEEPILLLGSVFDANSLGKWIYDWTVFAYGPATPMSEVAGELWVLLIQLAGKTKRAEECTSRIRQTRNRDLVEDFLESGERLWQRFNRLLKICENYMWKAAKRDSSDPKHVTMGRDSGCEFVDSIFGRDRELERTEKLMTGMRLWSMRFDANCDDILRNPGA